jgi:hypothetical protein
MITKTCSKCKIKKTLDEFNQGNDKYGKTSKCKLCQRQRERDIYKRKNKIPDIVDLEYEFWIPIKGYENLYLISNQKRIKSLARDGRPWDKIIKLTPGEYYTVSLRKEYKTTRKYFHILYASAFLPNPKNLPQVNHLDGDKHNNELWNYEWATAKRNLMHAREIGLNKTLVGVKGISNPSSKFSERQIKEIINSTLTHKEISAKYGISQGYISNLKSGRSKRI